MPHIDEFLVKAKYRAWDNDILSQLKISDNSLTSQNITTTQEVKKQNKRMTNGKQKDDKRVTEKEQTDDKQGTKRVTNRVLNGKQKDDKWVTRISYSSLIGLQKKSVSLIFELTKISADKNSVPVSLKYMSEQLGTSVNSMKQTIGRLKKKEILISTETRCGRGGWAKYQLDTRIYQEILLQTELAENALNGKQKGDKWGTERGTERVTTTPSSSSSFNYLNTTTTSDTEKLQSDKLNDEWLQIDIEPLSKIGFTKTHLEQLASQKILSPDVVQDSIHMFAFDLENTEKAKSFKKDAISFFMGILRKGSPYTPSENYEHPKSKAMRLYLECKRKEEQRREAM